MTPSSPAESIRMDKWLWAARFFKTRAMASRSCDLGRIQSNGVKAKPARDVRTGDRLRIETESGIYEVDVRGLSAMRGPAAVAQTLYEETANSRDARRMAAEQKRALEVFMPIPQGRPTKRDRRRIIQFRGRG
jgi:ribosome-associated heat shock protein Hsp15